ncbi:hypothetical protein [Mariniflexile sp.]|uniref:hypothetical protein n=1 Tax=Mariniflexile sp. TaxID=1979402 RepID=UPI004047257D
MKTNFYLLLIFLLAFTFGNAQSTTEVVNNEINNTVSVSQNDDQVTATVETTTNTVNENEVLLIDASDVKESIARSSSDIKIYFNRLRNVDNLNLMFPKMNKAVKA